MEMRKVLARNFARIRREKGLTQIAVCEAANLVHAHISAMERGTANPTINTLFRVAVVLGVPPAALIELNPAEQQALAKLHDELVKEGLFPP